MEELLEYSGAVLRYDWSLFFKVVALLLLLGIIAILIYDRFIQRHNQIPINYPLGRMRYLFFMLREPMRQYLGDETYYTLREKVEWVNRAAYGKSLSYSFYLSKPYDEKRIRLRHANLVLEPEDVRNSFQVTFGARHPHPFTTKSIIGRSAMSDGAVSTAA
ncbi:MAG: hypothetical protein B6D59_07825 [Campylobacteraceae bacterium 4484_4]|nr:MAG: hypothetical protein B6D59_07825 [Campylobacteraceae bacterium 4484_4]